MSFSLTKGSVAHDCQPACELHELEGSAGTTGVTKSNPSREADSPQFAGTAGHGKAVARGYHSAAAAATSGGDYGPVVGPDENSQTSHGPEAEPQTSQEKYGGKGALAAGCIPCHADATVTVRQWRLRIEIL